jgi:hypothetical protein
MPASGPSPTSVLYRANLNARAINLIGIGERACRSRKIYQVNDPVCKTGATTDIHRCLAVFDPSKSASASAILHNEEHECSSLTEVADEKE